MLGHYITYLSLGVEVEFISFSGLWVYATGFRFALRVWDFRFLGLGLRVRGRVGPGNSVE